MWSYGYLAHLQKHHTISDEERAKHGISEAEVRAVRSGQKVFKGSGASARRERLDSTVTDVKAAVLAARELAGQTHSTWSSSRSALEQVPSKRVCQNAGFGCIHVMQMPLLRPYQLR